jgi:hypothetical protein
MPKDNLKPPLKAVLFSQFTPLEKGGALNPTAPEGQGFLTGFIILDS